jgi:hypothetical protein
MITYFTFEPSKDYTFNPLGKTILFTDCKGRIVIPGNAVFSLNKDSNLKVRAAYAVATSNGWKLMDQSSYEDPYSWIQNELNDVCYKALQSF